MEKAQTTVTAKLEGDERPDGESAQGAERRFAEEREDDIKRAALADALRAALAVKGKAEQLARRTKTIGRVEKLRNRLKRFAGEADREAVLKELSELNVSMYLSEICDSLTASNPKPRDTFALVEVYTVLCGDYSSLDFPGMVSTCLLREFQQLCAADKGASVTSAGGSPIVVGGSAAGSGVAMGSNVPEAPSSGSNLSRKRGLLRLAGELCLVGVLSSSAALECMVKEVTQIGFSSEALHQNLVSVEAFCRKLGGPLLGLKDKKLCEAAETLGRQFVRKCSAPEAVQESLRTIIVDYFSGGAQGLLTQFHEAVLLQEAANKEAKFLGGRIDVDKNSKYEALRNQFLKVHKLVNGLSELLDLPPPELAEAEAGVVRLMGTETEDQAAEREADEDEADKRWEDDVERSFYLDLLDLKDMVAGVLLGIKTQKKGAKEDGRTEGSDGAPQSSPQEESASEPKTIETKPSGDLTEENAVSEKSAPSAVMDTFLMKLEAASRPEQIDQLAVDFFYQQLNTKANRKKVAKSILSPRKIQIHVLPPYCRFIATVSQYLKDLAQMVTEGVHQQFKELSQERSPLKLELKIKTARFLGELTKFSIISPGQCLDVLVQLLEDFTFHHAEMACHLVQCAGRFLLHTPGCSDRANNLVDRMLRLSNAKNLPAHVSLMVEDTCFQLRAAGNAGGRQKEAKEQPIVKQFIRHLLFELLLTNDEEMICDCILQLPWDAEPRVFHWLKDYVLELGSHVKYDELHRLASLLCSLTKYRPELVIACVDELMEQIQIGLEQPEGVIPLSKRTRQMRLLSELYNYKIVDSSIIFDVLHHMIGLGGPTSFQAGNVTTPHHLIAQNIRNLAAQGISVSSKVVPLSLVLNSGGSAASGEALNAIREEEETTGAPEALESGVDNFKQFPLEVIPLWHPEAPPDPPEDNFRIVLVCKMLEACGHYFSRGAPRLKMDRFLTLFQWYTLSKTTLLQPMPEPVVAVFRGRRRRAKDQRFAVPEKPPQEESSGGNSYKDDRVQLPLFLESMVRDAMDCVRLGYKRYETLHAAEEAVRAFLTREERILSALGADVAKFQENDEVLFDAADAEDESGEKDGTTEEDSALEGGDDQQGESEPDPDDESESGVGEEDSEEAEMRRNEMMLDAEIRQLVVESMDSARMAAAAAGKRQEELLRLPPQNVINSTSLEENINDSAGQFDELSEAGGVSDDSTSRKPAPKATTKVRLVAKGGRATNGNPKFVVRTIDVPSDSKLSLAMKKHESEGELQKIQLKQFIMDSAHRIRMEDIGVAERQIRNELIHTHGGKQHPASSSGRGSRGGRRGGGGVGNLPTYALTGVHLAQSQGTSSSGDRASAKRLTAKKVDEMSGE